MAKLIVKVPPGVDYFTIDMGGHPDDELTVIEQINYYETKRYGDYEYSDPIEKQIVLADYCNPTMQFWSPDKANLVKKESPPYRDMIAKREEQNLRDQRDTERAKEAAAKQSELAEAE